MGLEDINVNVRIHNSQELIQLFQKASNLLEQLELTIDEINQKKLEITTESQP
ncbi:hypothetical protein [Lysinibacillus sp. 54212]|uniref:hypothetical protein n=1 Tax=Lysinibacillus sp. 54212 TaxID=3119829 RepID=UPI002FC94281